MKTIILLIPLYTIFLVSCAGSTHEEHEHEHSHSEHAHEHKTDEGEHHHGDGAIIIQPEEANRLGIVTKAVESESLNKAVSVTGQIINIPSGQAVISASGPGIVTLSEILTLGHRLTAGQAVGRIAAQNISGGDPNAAARVALNAAKQEVDRLTPLVKEGIVTQREYNAAIAAYESAQAAYSPKAASGVLTSPINGIVTSVLVSTGQYVEAGTIIATLSKSDKLLLRVDLPEKFRNSLGKITDAEFRIPQSSDWYSAKSLGGSITENAGINMPVAAGYIPVYFTIGNPNGAFAAGTYVEASIILSDTQEAIAVPTAALSEQYGNYFVYVKTGDHEYTKQKVTIGQTSGPLTEITSGLHPGQTIVVEGMAAVKLSESSGAVPEGHSHNH